MITKVIVALKVVAALLIGICAIIFFCVNKYTTSIALTVATIVILLPIRSNPLKISRIIFVLIILAMSVWNISTVDLPQNHYETGFIFFDKVVHIFRGFLENIFGIKNDFGIRLEP